MHTKTKISAIYFFFFDVKHFNNYIINSHYLHNGRCTTWSRLTSIWNLRKEVNAPRLVKVLLIVIFDCKMHKSINLNLKQQVRFGFSKSRLLLQKEKKAVTYKYIASLNVHIVSIYCSWSCVYPSNI
ncbi:hypothetical protein AAZX31_U036300 [Glycine max]